MILPRSAGGFGKTWAPEPRNVGRKQASWKKHLSAAEVFPIHFPVVHLEVAHCRKTYCEIVLQGLSRHDAPGVLQFLGVLTPTLFPDSAGAPS